MGTSGRLSLGQVLKSDLGPRDGLTGSLALSLRRERVLAVAVFLTDLPVAPVNDEFAVLSLSNTARGVDRLLLRSGYGACALGTLALCGPSPFGTWNNMYISS